MRGSTLAHKIVPAASFTQRRDGKQPDILLLHYTGMVSADVSLERLTCETSGVSCHYLIDEHGTIIQMVDEDMRAWHAGAAAWKGETDINSRSIGIEIQNPGHEHGYVDFPEVQMTAVVDLCRDIVERHSIRPERVLGHADVAPGRKKDPGEKFDWAMLFTAGVGHWVEPEAIGGGLFMQEGEAGEPVAALQSMLGAYGYEVALNGQYDRTTVDAVTAFQRHFRPAKVDGVADQSTIVTLQRLIDALPESPLA